MLSKIAQTLRQQAEKIAELERENQELRQKIASFEKKASVFDENTDENRQGLFFGEIDENGGKTEVTSQDLFARFFPVK